MQNLTDIAHLNIMWQDLRGRTKIGQDGGQTLRMPDNPTYSRINGHPSNNTIISSCFPYLVRPYFTHVIGWFIQREDYCIVADKPRIVSAVIMESVVQI